MKKIVVGFLVCLFMQSFTRAESRVMIVSIDGLRPDVALRADMPQLRALMADGSFTFFAYTTPAAVTLPSHTSMLTGVTIERHGITGNDDIAAANEKILVPTIFDLTKKAGISSGMAAGKTKFSIYAAGKAINFAWFDKATSDTVAGQAVNIIRQHQPRLMFVHFPEVDAVGHSKGWGSQLQIAAVQRTDKALGMVIDELKRLDLYDKTNIIISADHGGSGLNHGKDDDRSKFIPWIITGPGVQKNCDLTQFRELKINTYDTFATACSILEIPLPEGSDGKVVKQAFAATDLMGGTKQPSTQPATTTQPVSHLNPGHWCPVCAQAVAKGKSSSGRVELMFSTGYQLNDGNSAAADRSPEVIAP